MPRKEYSHCSSAPTRCIEYTSPYIVQANAGQDRLEVQPCDIPENQQPFWAPGHGPVCVQTVHPVPTLLQPAATSLFISNRCISSGLDSHGMLCESSVESGGLGSCTSAITTSSSGASSSCLEDTTLVPDASEHADRPSPVDNTESEDVTNVANFLAQLCTEGYQYSSINSYRSAISSVHEKVDGHNVGQHPLISRLLKGIFHDRPPLPRHTNTWNVETVLNYLEGLVENQSLSLKVLTWKLTMLLALTRSSRSADLSQLDLEGKHTNQLGSQIANFFFPSFPANPTLCPVMALKAYENKTKPICGDETKLLISFIKPHKL